MILKVESRIEVASDLERASGLLDATGAEKLFSQVAKTIPGTRVGIYATVGENSTSKQPCLSVGLIGPVQVRDGGRMVTSEGVVNQQEEYYTRLQISVLPHVFAFYLGCEEISATGAALLWSEPITNHSNLAEVIKQGLERAGIRPPADKTQEFNALFKQ